jgi:signal transduction histidine kinase
MPPSANRPIPSIRTRLLWRTLTTVLIGAAIGAVAAGIAVSAVVRDVMESALEETAQALVVIAEHQGDVAALAQGRAMPAPAHEEAIHWQLRHASGRLIARSHGAPDTAWPSVPLVEGHTQTADVAVYSMPGHDLWLQVAQPLAEFRGAQVTAAIAAGGTVFALGVMAAAVLGWMIRRELQPLTEFARTIEAIGPDTIALTEPELLRRELVPSYRALSALLQRLQEKLRSERAFAAHAAHSLRTPLAGLTAQLEAACVTPSTELPSRLSMATASAQRLAGVVDALLTMTRASDRLRWSHFDAAELASVATGRVIEVNASQLLEAGTLYGDFDLLAVAVANLVDNAERHGAHRAEIRATQTDDRQRIEIADDGPGVSRERLASLQAALEAFEMRGEIDPELGLGLTLAVSVARAHKGCLNLECTRSDRQGFCARLEWPAAPRGQAIGLEQVATNQIGDRNEVQRRGDLTAT